MTTFYDTLKSTPALADGVSLTYLGQDDAKAAFTVNLSDLAKCKDSLVMPFRHPEFLRQACLSLAENGGCTCECETYSILALMFDVQGKFAIIRNLRLMLKFNLLLMRKGKATFVISEENQQMLNDIPRFKREAEELGVDVSGYLDETYDDSDIAGCDNDFCLNQRETSGEAGDLVTIIRDVRGDEHVLVIVRANSPGKNQVALPGGFKEAKESVAELCKREAREETGYTTTGGVTTRWFELETVKSKTWDPRPLFAKEGMINHGLLRFDSIGDTKWICEGCTA